MLIILIVAANLDGEDGFKHSSWKQSCRETRKLLAYALQPNCPAEFYCGDAGEPSWTYSGTLENKTGAATHSSPETRQLFGSTVLGLGQNVPRLEIRSRLFWLPPRDSELLKRK
jgi:hypothetical protein